MLTADYQDFANRPFVSCRDNSVICGVKATPAGANLSRCDAHRHGRDSCGETVTEMW